MLMRAQAPSPRWRAWPRSKTLERALPCPKALVELARMQLSIGVHTRAHTRLCIASA